MLVVTWVGAPWAMTIKFRAWVQFSELMRLLGNHGYLCVIRTGNCLDLRRTWDTLDVRTGIDKHCEECGHVSAQ